MAPQGGGGTVLAHRPSPKTHGSVSGSVTTTVTIQTWSYHSIVRAAPRLYPCVTSDNGGYVALGAGAGAPDGQAARLSGHAAPGARGAALVGEHRLFR